MQGLWLQENSILWILRNRKTSKQHSLFKAIYDTSFNHNRWRWNSTNKGFTDMEKRLDKVNKTDKILTRQVIIVGALGNTARQNRDSMRMISSKGLIYALKAHIDKDHPLVLKQVR